MPAAQAIRVLGLRELNQAFARMDDSLKRELRSELKAVAEPVRLKAEALATSSIPRIGPMRPQSWATMRTGVTQSLVYVAPKQRGTRGRGPAAKRPNMANLLATRAMEPALAGEAGNIERSLETMIDKLADRNGF